MINSLQWKMEATVGAVYLTASEKGLQTLYFSRRMSAPLAENLRGSEPAVKILAQTVKELTEYFAGERTEFTIPLDVHGTVFQERVWNELKKIPYGETRSYKQIAALLQTKGVRAVGTANGRNPISIIVPCHRVIAADGGLGGYSGGLHNKRYLLGLERHPQVALVRRETQGL